MAKTIMLTLVALLLSFSPQASATSVTWDLLDVTFDDGATATGSFQLDASTETVSSWDITTGQGSSHFPTFTYNPHNFPNNFAFFFGSDLILHIMGSNLSDLQTRDLFLHFASALTDAGGEVSLVPGSGPTAGCNQQPFTPDCPPPTVPSFEQATSDLPPVFTVERLITSGCVTTDGSCPSPPPHPPPPAAPEPSTLLLFGSGLVGLGAWGRKMRKRI